MTIASVAEGVVGSQRFHSHMNSLNPNVEIDVEDVESATKFCLSFLNQNILEPQTPSFEEIVQVPKYDSPINLQDLLSISREVYLALEGEAFPDTFDPFIHLDEETKQYVLGMLESFEQLHRFMFGSSKFTPEYFRVRLGREQDLLKRGIEEWFQRSAGLTEFFFNRNYGAFHGYLDNMSDLKTVLSAMVTRITGFAFAENDTVEGPGIIQIQYERAHVYKSFLRRILNVMRILNTIYTTAPDREKTRVRRLEPIVKVVLMALVHPPEENTTFREIGFDLVIEHIRALYISDRIGFTPEPVNHEIRNDSNWKYLNKIERYTGGEAFVTPWADPTALFSFTGGNRNHPLILSLLLYPKYRTEYEAKEQRVKEALESQDTIGGFVTDNRISNDCSRLSLGIDPSSCSQTTTRNIGSVSVGVSVHPTTLTYEYKGTGLPAEAKILRVKDPSVFDMVFFMGVNKLGLTLLFPAHKATANTLLKVYTGTNEYDPLRPIGRFNKMLLNYNDYSTLEFLLPTLGTIYPFEASKTRFPMCDATCKLNLYKVSTVDLPNQYYGAEESGSLDNAFHEFTYFIRRPLRGQSLGFLRETFQLLFPEGE